MGNPPFLYNELKRKYTKYTLVLNSKMKKKYWKDVKLREVKEEAQVSGIASSVVNIFVNII